MKKRIATCLLYCILATTLLGATPTGQLHSFSIVPSPYFGISHFSDEIPVRTSFSLTSSLGLVGYSTKNISISLETHAFWVSDSLPFGFYRARGFTSVGLNLRTSFAVNPKLWLFTQMGTEINFYHSIEEVFASFSLQVGSELLLASDDSHTLSLLFPFSIHIRKEITALQLGVGFRYQIFPFRSGGTL